jgi:hypothetical protein
VAVICNGEPLQQYDNDDEKSVPNKVTTYFEAKLRAYFAVQLKALELYSDDRVYSILRTDGNAAVLTWVKSFRRQTRLAQNQHAHLKLQHLITQPICIVIE